MNRALILSGLFYYSFLPIIGELMGYMSHQSIHHLLFVCLFLCQMILASIKFQTVDDTLLIFSKFAVRLIACFLVINAMAAKICFLKKNIKLNKLIKLFVHF